jgi:hypothetical protein
MGAYSAEELDIVRRFMTDMIQATVAARTEAAQKSD